VWTSLPNWLKPGIREGEILEEGFEKTLEKEDNIFGYFV
jgi:hypothetical protein